MNNFSLHDFSVCMARLETERACFNKAGLCSDAAKTINHEVIIRVVQLLAGLKRQCERLELSKALDKVHRLEARVDSGICSYQIVMVELEELSNIIGCELDEKCLAFIPTSKSTYFERDDLFGDKVYHNFKSVGAEIKDAGNCLAADLNTAAVFHLMRASEFGLRALAQHLDAVPAKWPIEFSQWSDVIKDIAAKLESNVSAAGQMTRDHDKDAVSELYNGLLADVRHLKVTRDRVMHTRESYDEETALSVFDDVEKFMRRLADGGISES